MTGDRTAQDRCPSPRLPAETAASDWRVHLLRRHGVVRVSARITCTHSVSIGGSSGPRGIVLPGPAPSMAASNSSEVECARALTCPTPQLSERRSVGRRKVVQSQVRKAVERQLVVQHATRAQCGATRWGRASISEDLGCSELCVPPESFRAADCAQPLRLPARARMGRNQVSAPRPRRESANNSTPPQRLSRVGP